MNKETIQELAKYILDAQDNLQEIKKITLNLYPNLSIDDAYLIQEDVICEKIKRGDKISGPKMGLTSLAKLSQMNVTDPIYGFVFNSMIISEAMNISNFIHPKVEPEIGFVMAEDIKGANVTKEDILKKVKYIFPAMEIIDSRYKNFDFTLPDVIADNTSAAGAVFGTYVALGKNIDLAKVEVSLKINGQTVGNGAGAAVMEHPANSVACLANMLFKKGKFIKAGEPILTGGITAAYKLSKGDVVAAVFNSGLGSVQFRVI